MKPTDKRSKTKPKVRSESSIDSDSVQMDILQQVYLALKDKNPENIDLTGNENDKAKMNETMELVYNILYKKDNIWNPSDEKLYSLLERVTFLKARENNFRDFFDTIEDVIECTSRLDFSKRIPFSKVYMDKRNLFNYAVTCLNILVEKIESSVVSNKAVNTMLGFMPGTVMLVTNNSGAIRFVNDLGEKLLGIKNKKYLGKSVSLLIDNHEQISKQYLEGEKVKDKKTNLIIPGSNKQKIPVSLTILEPNKSDLEVEEIVYTILVDNTSREASGKSFYPVEEIYDKTAPVNSILSAANLLSSRFTDEDGKKLIDAIKENAEKLKSDAKDSLNTINDNIRVSIATIINEVLDSLKSNEGFDQMTFNIDVDYDHELSVNSKLIRAIFQNLISSAIKHRSYRSKKSPSVKIFVRDLSQTALLIRVNDNGIKPDIHKKRTFQESLVNHGQGMGLYLVQESVTQLKGTMEVYSTPGKGNTVVIHIPCKPGNKKRVQR